MRPSGLNCFEMLVAGEGSANRQFRTVGPNGNQSHVGSVSDDSACAFPGFVAGNRLIAGAANTPTASGAIFLSVANLLQWRASGMGTRSAGSCPRLDSKEGDERRKGALEKSSD